MAEQVIKAGRIKREKQRFFLGNEEISGVQDVAISYSTNISPVKSLGMEGKCLITTFQGPQQGEADVSSLIISEDPLIEYTGDKPVNGYLIKDISGVDDNFGFLSGYLTSYSASFGIGQIPRTSANFQVFGDVGRLSVNDFQQVSGDLSNIASGIINNELPLVISSPGSLDVCFDDKDTNRLQSLDVNISTPRLPIYGLGNRYPIEVKQLYPIQIDCSLKFDLNDYQATTLRDEVCSPTVKNLFIRAKDHESDQVIATYCFEDLYKISERQSSNESSETQLEVNYRGWLFDYTCSNIPAVFCPGNQTGRRDAVHGPLDFYVVDDTSQCCISVTGESLHTGIVPNTGIHISEPFGEDSDRRQIRVEPFGDTTGCATIRIIANDDRSSGWCEFEVCNLDLKPTITDVADQTIAVLAETGPLSFTVDHEDPLINPSGISVSARSDSDLIVTDSHVFVSGQNVDDGLYTINVTGEYQTGQAKIVILADDGNFFKENFFFVTVTNEAPEITNITNSTGINMNICHTGEFFEISVSDNEIDASGIDVGASSSDNSVIDSNTGILIEGTSGDRYLHIFKNVATCQEGQITITVSADDNISSGQNTFIVNLLNEPPTITSIPSNVIISTATDTGTGFGFSISDDFSAIGDLTITTGMEKVDTDAQDFPDVYMIGAGEDRSLLIDPQDSDGSGFFDWTITGADCCENSSHTLRIEINQEEATGSVTAFSWSFDELGFQGDGQNGNYRSYVGNPDLGRNSPWTLDGTDNKIRINLEDSSDPQQGSDGCGGTNDNTQTANATGIITVEDNAVIMTATWLGQAEIHSPLFPDDNWFNNFRVSAENFDYSEFHFDNIFLGASRAPGGSEGSFGCCDPDINPSPCNAALVTFPIRQEFWLDVGDHTGHFRMTTMDELFHKDSFFQINFDWRHPKTKIEHKNSWKLTDEGLIYFQDQPVGSYNNQYREYHYIDDSGKYYTGDFSRNNTTEEWELDIGGDSFEMDESMTGIPFAVSGSENYFGISYNFEQGDWCNSPGTLYNTQNQIFSAEHKFVLSDERDLQVIPEGVLTEFNTSGQLAVCHLNGTGFCWIAAPDGVLESCDQEPSWIHWSDDFDNGFIEGLTAGHYTILVTGSAYKQPINPKAQSSDGDFIEFNFRIGR